MSQTTVANTQQTPGEMLVAVLGTQGLSQADLAIILGRTPQYINELVKNRKIFDAQVALELEDALGVSAEDWLNVQLKYQRGSLANSSQSRKALFSKYPFLADALRLGWIENSERIDDLEINVQAFEHGRLAMPVAANSQSMKLRTIDPNVDAWNYQVYREAMRLENVLVYDPNKFDVLLTELKVLLAQENGVTQVQPTLLRYGIRLVFVPHIRQCPVDGVASHNKGQPYIGMSLRIARFDHFWFVLFHELAHVWHKHEEANPDNVEQRGMESEIEAEANQTAQEWLIPDDQYKLFVRRFRFTLPAIEAFAETRGVHPAIVLGRLKLEGYVPWSKHARAHPSVRDHLQ